MWEKKGLKSSGARLNYLYSDEELRAFVEPMKELARVTKQVHAMFNNCYEDKALRSALQFMTMLA